MRKVTPAVKKIENNGITGANALWDGPLDMTGFPMGKGSSNGKDGMENAYIHVVLKYVKKRKF